MRTVAAFLMGIAVLGPLATVGCGWSSSVGADPFVMTQPVNVTITAEQTATFAVSAKDDIPLTYQWYNAGVAIPGATSSTYVTPAMPLTADGSKFTVTVGDGTTLHPSTIAVLNVNPKATLLVIQPVSNLTLGASPVPVAATSNSPGPIHYSIVSGPATVSNNIVTVNGKGPVIVGASQLPSGDYAAATASTRFMVMEHVIISPVTPGDLTMGPGTQQFSASVTGGTLNTILWSASGGSFSGNVWTSPNVAGKYTITATSVDDPTKTAFTSMIVSPPIITQQPNGGSFCPNTNLNMTVAALYATSFQWSLSGKPLNGAGNPTYSTVANASIDAGQYTASANNGAGTAISNVATISVGSSISTNPQSITVGNTQTGSFSTTATGVGPFTYQWYVVPSGGNTGILIPGAISNSYTTPAVNGTFTGNKYYAVVSDACNLTLTTTLASLTVTGGGVPPTIIVPPASQSVVPGAGASFSVQAEGTPTLTYQWFWVPAGSTTVTPISGATAAQYALPSSATSLANDQDQYFVTVQNAFGQAASQRVTLAVGAGILITQQPVSAYIQPGDSATYTVAATSSLPLTYQWFEASPGTSNFTPIQGATSTSYTLTNSVASQSGSDFYVVVSNGITSSVQSSTAALFVGPLSSIPLCGGGWNELGTAAQLDNCSYELTAPNIYQRGEIVWPNLIATDNLQLNFTIATSNSTHTPADGFALLLGDPSLGATLTSLGGYGEGLGARGIPGLAIAFDVFENDLNPGTDPQDPPVPYLGIGRGETNLWENPYFNVNTAIPALTAEGETISHDYVLTLHNGSMTMTMDGVQVFSGIVSVPPTAYLYLTASTGQCFEQTVVSNLTATVTAP